MNSIPRLMIAAPSSGSGKSVITSGLMAAFSTRCQVQGFKVGPDYIDPMYHTAATGRPSRNLDGWMLSNEQTRQIFMMASKDTAISIIEGVMGLFDGYGSDPLIGSSAGIAALLKTPIILVIDCSKMSGSAAALVYGFHTFLPSIQLAGVICNRVGSNQHGQWLTESIEQQNSVPVLGCIPRIAALQIPERHLGLFTVPERTEAVKDFIQDAASILTRYVDVNKLLTIARAAQPLPGVLQSKVEVISPGVRLAVARDEAFCFYYEDNFDELQRCGAEIVPFSPLTDAHLPEGISGIYFGGGYPELYADRLSNNIPMRNQVSACCRADMPVYAECGGLMYLTQGIRSQQGSFPLVGTLPGWCEMGEKLCMGYLEVETLQSGLLAAKGVRLRGHEFHYSRWQRTDAENTAYCTASRDQTDAGQSEGYVNGNLLASYIHLHYCQNPQLARTFVDSCQRWYKNHAFSRELE